MSDLDVHLIAHYVPLADSTCGDCGQATVHNLAAGLCFHVDDQGQAIQTECTNPYPAIPTGADR